MVGLLPDETWPSGLRRLIANQLILVNSIRGFESLRLSFLKETLTFGREKRP